MAVLTLSRWTPICTACAHRGALTTTAVSTRWSSVDHVRKDDFAYMYGCRRGFAGTARRTQEGEKRQSKVFDFPPERIRNFAIIAHVDHGKSTLADRLLEYTDTIPRLKKGERNQQILDTLKVERERGITVRAMSVSMIYTPRGSQEPYLLNLIDTPGHVDFSSEVLRSLMAVQGALLLVDCTQGIQAQTLSVLDAAHKRKLSIVGVINKIDLPNSDIVATTGEVTALLEPNDPLLPISAKTGNGIDDVLESIVAHIPSPQTHQDQPFAALAFDSWYDDFKGVISLISVKSGRVKKGDRITSIFNGKSFEINDVGVLHPTPVSLAEGLGPGQVGYIICGMKDPRDAYLGDTFHHAGVPVERLEHFQPQKAMVYAGLFPYDSTQFPKLDEAVRKLTLTDRSVSVQKESSAALGVGFRLGFLGSLHAEVFRQRLEDEFGHEVLVTKSFVALQIVEKDGSVTAVYNPGDFPSASDLTQRRIQSVQEPIIRATIISPDEYTGPIMELCAEHRGEQVSFSYLNSANGTTTGRVSLIYKLPLSAIAGSFHSKIKSITSGFASFDYEEAGWAASNMVRMDILINGRSVDALSSVLHRSEIEKEARLWTARLKEVVPRQQYEVVIQAAVGAKIIARERLAPMRKDVTGYLYGGDVTRKMKLLSKQKAGLKKLKRIGNVDLPPEAFYQVLKSGGPQSNKT